MFISFRLIFLVREEIYFQLAKKTALRSRAFGEAKPGQRPLRSEASPWPKAMRDLGPEPPTVASTTCRMDLSLRRMRRRRDIRHGEEAKVGGEGPRSPESKRPREYLPKNEEGAPEGAQRRSLRRPKGAHSPKGFLGG